jgi:hypothetical protein
MLLLDEIRYIVDKIRFTIKNSGEHPAKEIKVIMANAPINSPD